MLCQHDTSSFSVRCARQLAFPQPSGLNTRSVDAGCRARAAAGRIGRRTSSPRQFGQTPPSFNSAQALQNVHSKVQILASGDSLGRSRSQHSQLGRISSMVLAPVWGGESDCRRFFGLTTRAALARAAAPLPRTLCKQPRSHGLQGRHVGSILGVAQVVSLTRQDRQVDGNDQFSGLDFLFDQA